MQTDTIIVTNNNLTPQEIICFCQTDTTAEPPEENTKHINYNSLTAAEKTQLDECRNMLLSKI